ncbi:Lin1244/Lin1753 domain-containing protein [candidate division KSB1 bacterium]
MAAPLKEGLDYFPLDVNFDSDDKVAFIIAKHGAIAVSVIVLLLSRVYRNG